MASEFELPFQWQSGNYISPFVASSDESIAELLGLLKDLFHLNAEDTVVDIGSGDGRVLLAVHQQFQCRCVGLELDEELVTKSKENLIAQQKAAGSHFGSDAVSFQVADCTDPKVVSALVADASVIVAYLLPEGLSSMQAILEPLMRRSQSAGSSPDSAHLSAPRLRGLVVKRWSVPYLSDLAVPWQSDGYAVYVPR